LKIRKIFYFVIKWLFIFTLIKYEPDFTFWLFKPLVIMDKSGWMELLRKIAFVGFDLVIYALLHRRLIEWDRIVAEKIFRIHDY
jgi:hypothetical protein